MNAVLRILAEEGIDRNYGNEYQYLTNITLFTDPVRIPIERVVRYSDPLSPKLFTAFLEIVYCKMNWEDIVSSNSKRSVCIVMGARGINDLHEDLNARNMKVGLKINAVKTKVMVRVPA